jgi:hypothetical protein
MPHQVLKLLLCLCHFVFKDRCLLFLCIVNFIDLVKFLLRLDSKTLCNVEILVRFLIVHLISSQLLLCSVQTHTDLLF